MATVEKHIDQWKHNRKCAESIDRKYRDWQINVIFYAALHAVDAVMSHLGITIENHETRNTELRTNESFTGIRVNYLNLYRISKVTRYDADPDSWLPEQFLTVSDLVSHLLDPIEREVEQILGKKLKLSPVKVQE